MVELGKNRRKIFVSNLDTKRKYYPSKISNGGTNKKDHRNRQEINEKNGTSE
jgi:hypothetical protein